MKKNKPASTNKSDKTLQIILGLEAYNAEMAPITHSEAEKFQNSNLQIFSEEDKKLL